MNENAITLPDRTPMLEAVGGGITAFASIEFAVGMCFASMLEPAERGRSVAAINAVRSFKDKMQMVDAVADVALSGDDLETWRNLRGQINKRKSFRDKLAHWNVGLYPGASTAAEIRKQKVGLLPPFRSAAHGKAVWDPNGAHKHRAITLDKVIEFTAKATQLATELINFGIAINPTKGGG